MPIANDLLPTEVATFHSALRLYFTNAEVKEMNLRELSDMVCHMDQPVKTVKASA